jgi:hypothetical protein
VYIVFIVMMSLGMIGAFALMPPSKIVRDDGTPVGVVKARSFMEELKANLEIFRDWKLLIMVSLFKYPLLWPSGMLTPSTDSGLPSGRMFLGLWRLCQRLPQQPPNPIAAIIHLGGLADPSRLGPSTDPRSQEM